MVASISAGALTVADVSVKGLGHSDASVDLESLDGATASALLVARHGESAGVAGRDLLVQGLGYAHGVQVLHGGLVTGAGVNISVIKGSVVADVDVAKVGAGTTGVAVASAGASTATTAAVTVNSTIINDLNRLC